MRSLLVTYLSLIVRALLTAIYFMGIVPVWSFDTTIPATCPIPRSMDIDSITIIDFHSTYEKIGAASSYTPTTYKCPGDTDPGAKNRAVTYSYPHSYSDP